MSTNEPHALPSLRIEQIQQSVRQAFDAVANAGMSVSDARKLVTSESANADSSRAGLLTKLAQACVSGGWESDEIVIGVDRAVAAFNEKRNSKDTSVATFTSELKRALHPSVRSHVADMFATAAEAWKAEGDLKPSKTTVDGKSRTIQPDRPLRKAFARQYHFVVQGLFQEAIAGRSYPTAEDMVEFAVSRDPSLSYKKVASRLAAITKQLTAFHADFPVDGIAVCVEYLKGCDEEALKAARPDSAPELDEEAPELDDASDDTVEGASGIDVLDDALGNA